MKLEQLQHRIARAEAVLEGRQHQVVQQWSTIRQVWSSALTPGRIVIAGLGLGFAVGLSEPKTMLGSLAGKVSAVPKLMKMVSAVSALFTASQAQEALKEAFGQAANAAAEAGEDVARDADAAAKRPATSARPDPSAADTAPAQPRPAEAATEVSER
jgi:hypothetical protein